MQCSSLALRDCVFPGRAAVELVVRERRGLSAEGRRSVDDLDINSSLMLQGPQPGRQR